MQKVAEGSLGLGDLYEAQHRRGLFLEQARGFRYKLAPMMRLRPQLASFFLSLPACAAAVAVVGVLRLGHQFPAAASSPSLLVPFLLPVLALSLEAGALVALSVAQLSELSRAPATPASARARATWPLLGMLLLVLVGAELIPRGTEHPGAFANDLLRTARASCRQGAMVPVPLLGLSVRCDEPQRIEGPMPGVPAVRVAMSELKFSDDLRRVEIAALQLTAARSLSIELRAGTARVAGLAPWSRSPRLSSLGRLSILGALGAVLWLVASVALRARPALAPPTTVDPSARRFRWLGYLLFALPGAVTAATFVSLDQERAGPAAYASAALWGALTLVLVAGVLLRRIPRILSSFTGF